jgi:hypothetical protein
MISSAAVDLSIQDSNALKRRLDDFVAIGDFEFVIDAPWALCWDNHLESGDRSRISRQFRELHAFVSDRVAHWGARASP